MRSSPQPPNPRISAITRLNSVSTTTKKIAAATDIAITIATMTKISLREDQVTLVTSWRTYCGNTWNRNRTHSAMLMRGPEGVVVVIV